MENDEKKPENKSKEKNLLEQFRELNQSEIVIKEMDERASIRSAQDAFYGWDRTSKDWLR